MTALRTLGFGVFAATIWAGGALACSPPPGDVRAFFEQQHRAYLEEVTSIYEARLANVVGHQDDPLVTFTVRKTGDLWGSAGPRSLNLQFENGHCSNYLIFQTDYPEGEGIADGMRVRVFVTPASSADSDLLYIVPEGPMADEMMSRWRAVRADSSGR